MTTANHSTNQQPNGLGNLGQIIAGQEQFKILTTAEIEALPEAKYLAYCKQAFAMPTTGRTLEEIEASATEILKELNGHNATEQNPCPWVLVEQAGTDDESIREDFATFKAARLTLKNYYYCDEIEALNVQIMRRNDDGTLTTEY